jgi:hypothetical protein
VNDRTSLPSSTIPQLRQTRIPTIEGEGGDNRLLPHRGHDSSSGADSSPILVCRTGRP